MFFKEIKEKDSGEREFNNKCQGAESKNEGQGIGKDSGKEGNTRVKNESFSVKEFHNGASSDGSEGESKLSKDICKCVESRQKDE